MADDEPFRVHFADDRIQVELRLAQLQRGHQTIDCPVAVRATYGHEVTRYGPHYLRIGPVAYEPPAAASSRPDDQTLEFLARKFDAFFLDDIYLDGLIAPDGGPWEWLGKLGVGELHSQDGWYGMGYSLSDEDGLAPAGRVAAAP
jgi:hypothetical protein